MAKGPKETSDAEVSDAAPLGWARRIWNQVAPLVGGVPAPNGIMDTADLLLIQRKALGLATF